jgi:peptidoglycan/xylan/chitin deacetylase (PgdA/CDA1 family)
MYHQITQAPAGQNSFQTGLYVDPSDLEKEMAYLVKKNYKSITPLEYYNLLMSGENPTQKTVMITFDDGVENQYTNAYPILKKYDLTGVFYIIAQRSAITAAQSKEMSDNGMVIDSHSSTHVDLTKVTDPTQLSYEVISSKYALQTTTGKTVYSFAYPGCGWNSETVWKHHR